MLLILIHDNSTRNCLLIYQKMRIWITLSEGNGQIVRSVVRDARLVHITVFLKRNPAAEVEAMFAAFPSIAGCGSEMMNLSFKVRVSRLKGQEGAAICYDSEPGPNCLRICAHNWHRNTQLMSIC
jgi:hypothetical protein